MARLLALLIPFSLPREMGSCRYFTAEIDFGEPITDNLGLNAR